MDDWRAGGDHLKLPLDLGTVYRAAKEVRGVSEDLRPVLVGGAPEPAQDFYRMLTEGGEAQAAIELSGRVPTEYDLEGAATLVYLVKGDALSAEDESVFRRATRKHVGIVCVLLGVDGQAPDVPYVFASDVVAVEQRASLPTERIYDRVASTAGEASFALAAKLPVLRSSVCRRVVRTFARQNGILGAAIFLPGADFPVLTLNQLRMVLRIAAAYGEPIDRRRGFELLATTGAAFGLRAVARRSLAVVPALGWVVKGGIAYAGTAAIGEAAVAYFEAGGTSRGSDAVRFRS